LLPIVRAHKHETPPSSAFLTESQLFVAGIVPWAVLGIGSALYDIYWR